MRLRHGVAVAFCLVACVMFSSLAAAEEIFTTTDALTAADPTQLGRLSRNGLAQDWIGSEPFPGVINPTTTYFYTAYEITVPTGGPFLQIEVDSVSTNTFVSAYSGAYDPTNLATNWLGDAGTSGNFFGTDPLFFQVIAPSSTIWLVVNNTGASGIGLGDPYTLTVEAFADTEFNDPPVATPEPASMLLLGTGLVGLIAVRRRRQAA
ncbi:MAG TPA: PEP-CTERM sorting domain-containing protein [Candidatus Sulfotelmatobacter sp.]|jgi:hypothetical protein|nr:PEP-CTERM sorting domain-containing protein [Candidatus Sulfotelmatobacter sp.]